LRRLEPLSTHQKTTPLRSVTITSDSLLICKKMSITLGISFVLLEWLWDTDIFLTRRTTY
jgi:hypothetical protein